MHRIDKIVYINLESRTDRKEESLAEFDKLGITDKVVRFNAIQHEKGFVGCSMSHIEVLKSARDDPSVQTILIFEDDVTFTVDPNSVHAQINGFFDSDLFSNFDVLFLASDVVRKGRPATIAKDVTVVRTVKAYTASAYIVHRRAFDKILAVWEENLLQLVHQTNPINIHMHDVAWCILQAVGRWYSLWPVIAKQRPSFSDLKKKFVEYRW